MKTQLENIYTNAMEEIQNSTSIGNIEEIRGKYLKKD